MIILCRLALALLPATRWHVANSEYFLAHDMPIESTIGIQQGDTLFSLLFALYVDDTSICQVQVQRLISRGCVMAWDRGQ